MEGRGRQGSQQEPWTKQATIEMEMRLEGAHSEEELARLDWKWQLWRGSQGRGCQDSVPLQTAEPLGSLWPLRQSKEENAGSFFPFTIFQLKDNVPGEIFL